MCCQAVRAHCTKIHHDSYGIRSAIAGRTTRPKGVGGGGIAELWLVIVESIGLEALELNMVVVGCRSWVGDGNS
jgi:hypothetical protein